MAVLFDIQPYPLGLISPTAGTPLPITTTVQRAHTVIVQAWITNTKNIFIGREGMNTATGEGVIAVLMTPGASVQFSIDTWDAMDPRMIFVDTDNTGDGALCSVIGAK